MVWRTLAFAALWLVLTGGDLHHPTLAILAVLGAVVVGESTGFGKGWRISALGLLRFIPFFVAVSFKGGLDVAARAFRSRRAIDPDLFHYRLRVPPDSAARTVFAMTLNLIPGTLCAEIEGRNVTVHVIDRKKNAAEVAALLEERVAALFGCALQEEASP